jgi:hypothetical protein
MEMLLKISSAIPDDAIVSLYIWNKDHRKFLVEKITISLKGF